MALAAAMVTSWTAADARAQWGGGPWGADPDYWFFVSLDGVYQRSTASLSDRSTFREYDETGAIGARYDLDYSGGLYSVSGGILLWRHFGLALGWSRAAGTASGALEVQRPHPLFYQRPRRFAAPLELPYEMNMGHFMLVARFPLARRWELFVTGGPSRLQLQQHVPRVTRRAERGLPAAGWEAANVTVGTEAVTRSGLGFNGGVDLTFRVHRNVGIGLFAQYAGGSLAFPLFGGDTLVDVGGPQAGAGLRLRF